MACSDEELVLLATSIAMELAKDMSEDEIVDLRNLINQISCSLTTLIGCRVGSKRNYNNQKK